MVTAIEYVNSIIGRCPDCVRDVDDSHHPNNRDCPWYRPLRVAIVEVEEAVRTPASDSPSGSKL
jgi:hypothetical protein